MCSRYSTTVGPEEIGKQIGQPLGVRVSEKASMPTYNIAPTEAVLAIVAPEGNPQARMVRWGLVPPWARKIDGPPRINARMERLLKDNYYGVAADPPHRALIVATEFYEWAKAEQKGKVKPAPFGFTVDGGRAFCFAGLCAINERMQGGPIVSAAILTCPPNELIRPIHDRMPAILADAEGWLTWMNPGVSVHDALSVCRPLAAERMTARPVSTAFNDARNKSPELLEPPAGEREQQLALG
ncbi:MAG: SOS response-associated peptidase [Solirubrobacterales bacterium]